MPNRNVDLRRELEELRRRAEGAYAVRRTPVAPREKISLAEAARGAEERSEGGAFYRLLCDASSVWPEADVFHREYLEALGAPLTDSVAAARALAPLTAADPNRILYLDIETTGLGAASPLFLIGLMYTSGERLIVDQLFARDYTEERSVLAHLRDAARGFDVLVTYNGISFDAPYIRDRSTVHRLSFAPPAAHVDLLLAARLLVGKRTPNHRLQTLETHLCKRARVGDIPGSEIPGAYHEFVRTGNAKNIASIIHHNRLDLVTMLQLVTIFLASRS